MSDNPGGPTGYDTRCLICRTRKQPDYSWYHLGPRSSTCNEPFAGYFCTSACRDVWKDMDEQQRLRQIFGHEGKGLDLLIKKEQGEFDEDRDYSAPDAYEALQVPVFVELNLTEGAIYRPDPLTGFVFRTGKVARNRLTGYRQRWGGAFWRQW